jgi:hypothetical protein
MNKWQCKTGEGVARKLTAEAAFEQIRIICHQIISHFHNVILSLAKNLGLFSEAPLG